MRVAIVHDWLVTYGGAERVLQEVLGLFPDADLFSLVECLPTDQRQFLRGKPVHTSFVQRLPNPRRHYRKYLPLMPAAIERFDLSSYDLILSLSFAVAKGVLTTPDQLHICYLQARNLKYAYEERKHYPAGRLIRLLQDLQLSKLRVWDSVASRRPDRTIANSRFVQRWHQHRHQVESDVIYPPVETEFFGKYFRETKDDYYVTVGRLEPYKRMDVVVDAFRSLGLRLVVAGSGTELDQLRRRAGPNTEFLGWCPAERVAEVVAGARAFVFASAEDFGIAPVEAQACGTPVIAYCRGASAETVIDLAEPNPTGSLYSEQTPEALASAVQRFAIASQGILPIHCRDNAARFSPARFRPEFSNYVEQAWERFRSAATASQTGE